jgi:hypothetical protein
VENKTLRCRSKTTCPLTKEKIIKGVKSESYENKTCDNENENENECGDARWRRSAGDEKIINKT